MHDTVFGVMDIVKKSKSNGTIKKYDIHFDKLKSWCLQFKLSHLLALPSTVSMYLTSLIQTGVTSIFYAVKWYHTIFLFEDPCALEGGKRILTKPMKKKEQLMSSLNNLIFHKGTLDLFIRDLYASSYSYIR